MGQHDWLTLQCLGAHLAYNWAVSFQQIAEDFYAEVGDETDPLWREYPGLQYDELKEINKAWKHDRASYLAEKLHHYGYAPEDAERIPSHVCYAALRNWDRAYRTHIKDRARVRRPRYKSWHRGSRSVVIYQSADGAAGRLVGRKLVLPKAQGDDVRQGLLKLAEDMRFSGRITSIKASWHAGRWHVTPQIETDSTPEPARDIGSAVGIDMGIARTATIADEASGRVVEMEGAAAMEQSLAQLLKRTRSAQRKLSRCVHV